MKATVLSRTWRITKRTIVDFIADDAVSQAAAIAFYTALSFAPILVILIALVNTLDNDGQHQIVLQIGNLMGSAAADVAEAVIENVSRHHFSAAMRADQV